MQQSVDQCSAVSFIVSWRSTSMHHHASRLIYDREISVFVNYVQRDLFRDGAQRRTFNLTDNLNALSTAQGEGSFGGLSIYEHFFLGDELLDPRTAVVGKLRDQEV